MSPISSLSTRISAPGAFRLGRGMSDWVPQWSHHRPCDYPAWDTSFRGRSSNTFATTRGPKLMYFDGCSANKANGVVDTQDVFIWGEVRHNGANEHSGERARITDACTWVSRYRQLCENGEWRWTSYVLRLHVGPPAGSSAQNYYLWPFRRIRREVEGQEGLETQEAVPAILWRAERPPSRPWQSVSGR
ncbi:hypothetical protein DAEQUDRAFT_612896 [Daedalea quercina L-15889]|uniref:Uncharacterized protein n=1 Tax=Daedalea quercina L-15889 TaxID=1314783 RepID=A0A165LGI7_9APHY|nr:hypothetical protein DAEQUDRAFT_612896 [Daedalea quercina L-15889]